VQQFVVGLIPFCAVFRDESYRNDTGASSFVYIVFRAVTHESDSCAQFQVNGDNFCCERNQQRFLYILFVSQSTACKVCNYMYNCVDHVLHAVQLSFSAK